ncbi:hypothetical protein [Brevundimonas aurifodinae]|uniref:Antitoxin n=2 Tax=Brevundimonas TaxID=41275 RepID=A0ABV1NPX7_9CAUL|nr:MAG: hypothetical protein B7Z42_15965 [Brevundimonas sp. 12-68-7]OYX32922.1 MAG: hypothetical protein B7Z01_09790 [Brevundimonas subvibrioides]
MADGALNIKLDDYASAKLAMKAKAMGVSPEEFATRVITEAVEPVADLKSDHASNYDLQEEGRPWAEVRPELVARMKRKLAERS